VPALHGLDHLGQRLAHFDQAHAPRAAQGEQFRQGQHTAGQGVLRRPLRGHVEPGRLQLPAHGGAKGVERLRDPGALIGGVAGQKAVDRAQQGVGGVGHGAHRDRGERGREAREHYRPVQQLAPRPRVL
jgi:hypothetical protein